MTAPTIPPSNKIPPDPEDRVPANPYEVNRSYHLRVSRRARLQAKTKRKGEVVQKGLFGEDLTVIEAEDAHRAHKRYMAAQEADKI